MWSLDHSPVKNVIIYLTKILSCLYTNSGTLDNVVVNFVSKL